MGIEVKTFEDAVKVDDMFFDGLYIIENESTGRRVSIILDENCIRWQGFAKGAEAHMMGVSDKKFRMHGYGWVPVRGRHEFRNGDGDKCVRNALRFVNDTARSYLKK